MGRREKEKGAEKNISQNINNFPGLSEYKLSHIRF